MKSKKALAVLTLVLLGLLALNTMSASAGGGCPPPWDCGCTRTPGYWMNHPNKWPVDMITVGGVDYTVDEAIAAIKAPVKGDKTFTMFPALVAAMLNIHDCTPCVNIDLTVGFADEWMANNPLGSGVAGSSEAWQYSHGEALYLRMDAYNNGMWPCAPECE